MTQQDDTTFDSENGSAESPRTAPSDREAARPHPLFEGMTPFEAEMMRVAMLDLNEDYSGCRPFIAATAKLPPDARRRLLVNASRGLLDFGDRHGAAECLKHAIGLDDLEPSEEVDRVVEAGLQIVALAADDDDQDLEAQTERLEEFIRIIEEHHQGPQASPSTREETEALDPCLHTSGGASSKTTYQRIFEFIDAHQGCLTREITAHIGKSVRRQLDEMDRGGVIVRVTKRDKYACSDARQKLHYTADQHVGHIGRYGADG